MQRRLRSPVLLVVAFVIAAACGPVDPTTEVEIAAPTPVATTEPVGIPLQPTPTPLGLPPALVPLTEVDLGITADAPGEAPSEAPVDPPAPTETALPSDTTRPDTPEDDASPTPAPAETTPANATDPSPELTPTPEPAPAPTEEPTTTPIEAPSPAPAVTPAPERTVTEVGLRPLGQAEGVPLVLPVARIELIGFHQAGHPGSQAINAAGVGVDMMTLDSRGRGTAARSAADIVVPPGEPVFAPVTGTVVAANDYVLYCQYDDALVYIEPDDLPGWQVRLFHVEGVSAVAGARVQAGVTQVAASARTLPFESQVDEFTSEPSWPHVHLEVVDTTVPDTRPPGPGCP
ncbi:MAG: hypothetical protein AAF567_08010 [Actinomycetota bacterium]